VPLDGLVRKALGEKVSYFEGKTTTPRCPLSSIQSNGIAKVAKLPGVTLNLKNGCPGGSIRVVFTTSSVDHGQNEKMAHGVQGEKKERQKRRAGYKETNKVVWSYGGS